MQEGREGGRERREGGEAENKTITYNAAHH